ncbi:MAG: carboxypeptidase regulatory-like domain-containing protein [Ignavibacteria bacterium]|nr:carboxypeptidase regulatory-like domain-containing protein [Ignavibacteria bacterium]
MSRKTLLKLLVVTLCISGQVFAADISGKVMFEGKAPKGRRLRMDADKVCKAAHKKPVRGETVLVNSDSTLRNVIVYVKEGLRKKKFKAPSEKLVFDQKGCIYTPHVLAIQTGQELEVRNSDPTLHNVHSLSKKNPSFNVAQPIKGMKLTKKFAKPELFKVKCEVHSWMGAYIGVFSHPYFAVTGDDGSFSLKKLPAGEYTIEAWHEKYGTQTMNVSVGAKESKTVDFTFKAK